MDIKVCLKYAYLSMKLIILSIYVHIHVYT